MTTSTSRRLAWSLWALGVLLAAASGALLILGWSSPQPAGAFGFRGFAAIFALSFGTVGALVASRHPGNPIGWIFIAVGILSGFQELANEYAIYAVIARDGRPPFGATAAWFPSWIWLPATSGAMLLLLLFPNGRLLSRRWRLVVVPAATGTIVASIG